MPELQRPTPPSELPPPLPQPEKQTPEGEVIYDATADVELVEEPVELADEMVEELEDLTDQLEEEGSAGIQKINKAVGLDRASAEQVAKETGLWDAMKGIHTKARGLFARTAEKIRGLVTSEEKELKQSPEKTEKLNLASVYEQLMTIIRTQPEIPKNLLNAKLETINKEYNLTDKQKEDMASILEKYSEKHANVDKIRKEYPDDKALYEKLFGKKPEGNVKIKQGPMTLQVYCDRLVDYIFIFHNAAAKENREVTPAEVDNYSKSGASTISSCNEAGLRDTIIAVNTRINQFEGFANKTVVHEEQHAMNHLFEHKIPEDSKKDATMTALTLSSHNKQSLEENLGRYLEYRSQFKQENIKDEILAYLADGHSRKEVLQILTKPKESGGIYNYLADDKQVIMNYFTPKLGESYQKTIEETTTKVFRTENNKRIKEGIDAYLSLRKKGYSEEKTIAILLQESLSRWKSVAELLTQTKPQNITKETKLAA